MLKPIVVGRGSEPPRGFDREAYQKRINALAGTRDGRPIIKLAWAPSERRWCPHRLGEKAPGYTFPIFCHGYNSDGELVAPDLWVLLERIEPQQFAPTWEAGRYSKFDGSVWDWKGPCPDEKYIELRVHSYHDGVCCPCLGETCHCGAAYEHCWGRYLEPSERLMEWIGKKVWESQHDPDVDPTKDIRDFTAPQAQRDLITAQQRAKEKEDAEMEVFDKEMRDVWLKQSHGILVDGFKQTEAGVNCTQLRRIDECSFGSKQRI